jgi:hypothetical protein
VNSRAFRFTFDKHKWFAKNGLERLLTTKPPRNGKGVDKRTLTLFASTGSNLAFCLP